MRTLIAMMLAVITVVAFSGCETVKGVGKDVKKAGEAIEKSAN